MTMKSNLALLLLPLLALQLHAATVYRSVDDQGRVTFSDQPGGGAGSAEPLQVDADVPSAARRQQAEQRAAELQEAAGKVQPGGGEQRAAQQQARQQRIEDAERRLEQSREVQAGDRVGTAGGGSRLRPEYHERVRKAEEALERAQGSGE